MAYALERIGVLDRRLTRVKSNAGAIQWECADGRLMETGEHSYRFTLTACDTLALCNLLHDNYNEIVAEARKEQQQLEAESDARKCNVRIPYR